MIYSARACYVTSDEECSLLGLFLRAAIGRHFLPHTISNDVGLERRFTYPRWELTYTMIDLPAACSNLTIVTAPSSEDVFYSLLTNYSHFSATG